MSIYDGFKFRPAKGLPNANLPLEEYERLRNIKREDMEYTNEHGYQVKVVIDPGYCAVMDMFYRILKSDLEDKKLVMICPNPWVRRYLSLVEMINKFGINMRNVHAFAMDEFADEDGNVCPTTYAPGLGYSFMHNFYGNIREDLRPKVEQWHTFNNENAKYGAYSKMIEDEGGADIIYSATGWPGHMAFIDPGLPEHEGMADTLEDFIKIKSGLVTPSLITVCEDSLMPQVGAAGDLWAVPPRAATIGPYDVVNAKERCIVHDGATPNGWQKMVSRMELYGDISKDCPSSIARLGKGVCYLAEAQATPIKHWFYGMTAKDLI